MKTDRDKWIKRLIILLCIFFIFLWPLAPSPSYQLPTELFYRALIPKYPNAKNIKNTYGCGFKFEVGKYELGKVKVFYENSYLIKTLFKYDSGRSFYHVYKAQDGGDFYQDFSSFFYQRYNITLRSLHITGGDYTSGTYVDIECETYSPLG